MDGRYKGRKYSNAEVENRIDRIIELIGSGIVMRKPLLQFITKEFEISDSQFDKDFRKARKDIQELNRPKIKRHISNAILKLEILYNKNFKMQDYRECRNVQAELNKLLGLYKPIGIDLTTAGDKITGFIYADPNDKTDEETT